MEAFLLVDFSAGSVVYHQPLVAQVKQALPGIAMLDVDANSDELLLHYALQLLQQAEKAVILLRAAEQEQNFGKLMPLLEELFKMQENRLLLLHGTHQRLLRMLQARPDLTYKQVTNDEEALASIKSYFA